MCKSLYSGKKLKSNVTDKKCALIKTRWLVDRDGHQDRYEYMQVITGINRPEFDLYAKSN